MANSSSPLAAPPPAVCSLVFLPEDLWPCVLGYLFLKEMCSLDSAILNRSLRPSFLSAIEKSRKSIGILLCEDSLESNIINWQICRYKAISNIWMRTALSLPPLRSSHLESILWKYRTSMRNLSLLDIELSEKEFMLIGNCRYLQSLTLHRCSLSGDFDLSSLCTSLQGLTELSLSTIPVSIANVESLSRCCSHLTILELVNIPRFTDERLDHLINNISHLICIKLSCVDITDIGVRMLMNWSPRIRCIEIGYCKNVSAEVFIAYLQEITIPCILTENDCHMLRKNIETLNEYVRYVPSHFLDGLMTRLLDACLGSFQKSDIGEQLLVFSISDCIYTFCSINIELISHFVTSGILPQFLGWQRMSGTDRLIDLLMTKSGQYHECLLRSGLLSYISTNKVLFSHLSHLTDDQISSYPLLRHLPNLTAYISTIPIKQWIDIIPMLLDNRINPSDKSESIVHSICMSCSTREDVARLVGVGALAYWNGRVSSLCECQEASSCAMAEDMSHSCMCPGVLKVLGVLSHLRSIDHELS